MRYRSRNRSYVEEKPQHFFRNDTRSFCFVFFFRVQAIIIVIIILRVDRRESFVLKKNNNINKINASTRPTRRQ